MSIELKKIRVLISQFKPPTQVLKGFMYSVCHKVEISERFKSHRLKFKVQRSTLKHVEKIDH